MKKLVLLFVCLSFVPLGAQRPANADAARWEQQAQNVTIVRDDWGIPHVYGKSDADAVFGVIYAQAEDDFNRVETNYLTSLGRLAEAEGESAIYQDLRMKIFIDPADMSSSVCSSLNFGFDATSEFGLAPCVSAHSAKTRSFFRIAVLRTKCAPDP